MADSTTNKTENDKEKMSDTQSKENEGMSIKPGISGFVEKPASAETVDKTASKEASEVVMPSFVESNNDTVLKTDTPSSTNIAPVKKDEPTGLQSVPKATKKKSKKLLLVLISFVLLLIGVLAWYFLFNTSENILSPFPINEAENQNQTNQNNSNLEFENPVNGLRFSNADADKFKNRKPVAVMVNNYEDARPSAGLSQADVVYEAVAESGITRLMPVFYSKIPDYVSSIRSARYYFAELAAGYKAEYYHWGGAHVPDCQKQPADSPSYCPPVNGMVETEPDVDAYDRIVKLGLANLDGGNYACDQADCAFGRDPNKIGKVALEHTAFVRLPETLELAKKIRPDESWHRYIPIVEWKFKDEAPMDQRGDVGLTTPIVYDYWTDYPGFQVKWVYDKEKNEYTRYQGGVKQVDAANNQDLSAKVVIVRFTNQKPVGDKKNHLYHDIVGTGEVLIFQDGKVIKGKWSTGSEEDRDQYTDIDGNPVELNRGQIWVQLVPTGNTVSYGNEVQNTPPATSEPIAQ